MKASNLSKLKRYLSICLPAIVLLGGLKIDTRRLVQMAHAQVSLAAQAPRFEVDPFWPKPLPNHWVLGATIGVWADDQDHIWILHRSSHDLQSDAKGLEIKPPFSEICCAGAPPVLEFDQEGNLLRHWGGPGLDHGWMDQEHGITVDYKGNVWLGGGGGGDSQVMKFTKDGKFLMQVGKKNARLRPGTSGSDAVYDSNSLDMENFGRPTKIVVDAKTNEAYVSDGYVNHRVVVMDADTGKFKRIWGAYGNKPDDALVPGPRNLLRPLSQPSDRGAAHDPNTPPLQQFRNPVHCVMISHDDLVYVCDRQADRLQVFTKDGKFVKEMHILNKTMNAGSVWDIAFSRDPQETFLYVADGENSLLHILRRDTLEEVTAFGDGGRQPGQWYGIHNIATDSKGNLYTTETYEGKRVQKFTYKGVGPVTKRYQGTLWPSSSK